MAPQEHPPPRIELRDVTKRFADHALAADQINLAIQPGEKLVLVGESGCGKTTTLRLINRLIDPDHGSVLIDGVDLATRNPVQLRRSIGYVIQEVGLFPHLSATENIGLVPRILGWNPKRIRDRSRELLELVNLDPAQFADRLPAQMSGGQRQRVGLARALAAEPRIMLMDEPFGAVDPINRAALQDEFLAIHQRLDLTTVIVTHDIGEALLLGDRIAIMAAGKILRIDTPKAIAKDPGTDTARQLIHGPLEHAAKLATLIQTDNGANP
ncbi:ABC transporter ATP-binding protein [Mucisphaera sp.]|uniref:ABC transporter ATP-binding protein n=1 Tax=Mucisphaera sp. TaxID=2913024 RepID=UPI003D10AD99